MADAKYAVIVAGGKGLRMNSDLPKQFMTLKGTPVLMRTMSAFFLADEKIRIILVLPEIHHEYWKSLIDQFDFDVPHKVVSGGSTRFQSVRNGLMSIDGNGLVAIHDGVRPLISAEIINNSYATAELKGSAIAVVRSKDSIRRIAGDDSESVNRENYRLVQTPQTFQLSVIRHAYMQEEKQLFTDDASVCEHAGHKVTLVDGSYRNIKITTPEDMEIAAAFLRK